MKKAKVVIGSGYGDEGKGVFTDYLSSKSNESLVIRFNGGAQAGHTVITPEGKRHVFGHFGANSFLPNSKTVLSEFFVVNPLLFAKEKTLLNNINVNPQVFINKNSPITTPYEMILNQWQEDNRGSNRHGSCGVGFGETIHREESNFVSLQMRDIFADNFKEKLFKIREYFHNRVLDLGLNTYLKEHNFALEDNLINKFMDDCIKIMKNVEFYDKSLPESNNIVFEGAQGLLLDQNFGFFPHVTRSNTGLKNVVKIAEKYNIKQLDVLYATRCYTTRHGSGPLRNELKSKPYERVLDPTNIPNQYQGSLRFAYLDLDVLEDSITKDRTSVNLSNILINQMIGISCLDQTNIVKFYHNNKLQSLPNTELSQYVSQLFYSPILESWKGDRKHIKEIL